MKVIDGNNDLRRLRIKIIKLFVIYAIGISIVSFWVPLVATNEFWPYFISIAATYQCISMLFELWILSNHKYVFGLLGKRARAKYSSISDFAMITNTQFICLIHSIIAGICAIVMLLSPTSPIHQDHLFGSSFPTILHSVHSSAFFLAELLELLLGGCEMRGAPYVVEVVHHILACLGFFTGAFGIGLYYSVCILLSEFSTIFVDLKWLAGQSGQHFVYRWAKRLYVVSFLVVRVGFIGFYFTPIAFHDLGSVALNRSIDPTRFPIYNPSIHDGLLDFIQAISLMVCILLIFFHLLNLFFLSQIYGMVTRKRIMTADTNQKGEEEPLLSLSTTK